MHFPLPPAEAEHTPHDANQRHILLYGVGRPRDDAKHAVKKMTKGMLSDSRKCYAQKYYRGSLTSLHNKWSNLFYLLDNVDGPPLLIVIIYNIVLFPTNFVLFTF